MKYYIGVDQGCTKTLAVVINSEGHLLSLGNAKGGYHHCHGLVAQLLEIEKAVTCAINQLSNFSDHFSVLYGGLTGADWPDENVLLADEVRKLNLATTVIVVNDAYVAFRGGTNSKKGAVLVAGTGGNCAILSPTGEQFLYHYYQEDNLQGAGALGHSALTAIYRSETFREIPTILTSLVLERVGAHNVDELLRMDVEKRLPISVNHLAPLVFTAADRGDEVALGIVKNFSHGLSKLVVAGLQRFSMENQPVEVVLSGSVFKANTPMLFQTLVKDITQAAPLAQIVQARYEPVVGAALLAMEADGITITPEMHKNIGITSEKLELIRWAKPTLMNSSITERTSK